jgi:predicted lysophospholipase L1 biosynthesis ABC-type transport system permease subunit
VERAWADDPDVLAVNDTRIGVVTIGEAPVTVFTHAAVGDRPLPVVVLAGRMPTGPDEIALAPDSAGRAGVRIGDVVTASGRASARLHVTGTAFVPEDSHNGYADGAWVVGGAYDRLFPDRFFKYHRSHVALRPGADVGAAQARLNHTAVGVAGPAAAQALEPAVPPAEVAQIRNIRALPLALGAFLALLAVGATGHALATTVRRRRHELAVLRALGVTRRQSRLIVAVQAAALAAAGLFLGAPLGVAVGRALWRAVADGTPLLYVPPLAVLALVLVGPVVLLVATLLAAVPARRAARLRVGDTLRAE